MILKKGGIYQAVRDVPMGDLTVNKNYIYVEERSDYMIIDRLPEYLVNRMYHFFDVKKERYCEWVIDGKEDDQAITLQKYLQAIDGGWARPDAGEIKHLPIDYFNWSRGKELIRDHLLYFKAIAEGEEGVENIFTWIEKYDHLLTNQMTGQEKLEFRRYPFKSICYWLNYFDTSYTIRARYSWLDGLSSSW